MVRGEENMNNRKYIGYIRVYDPKYPVADSLSTVGKFDDVNSVRRGHILVRVNMCGKIYSTQGYYIDIRRVACFLQGTEMGELKLIENKIPKKYHAGIIRFATAESI